MHCIFYMLTLLKSGWVFELVCVCMFPFLPLEALIKLISQSIMSATQEKEVLTVSGKVICKTHNTSLHVQCHVPKSIMFPAWDSVLCVAAEGTHPYP